MAAVDTFVIQQKKNKNKVKLFENIVDNNF